jgi:hypothetical protein
VVTHFVVRTVKGDQKAVRKSDPPSTTR